MATHQDCHECGAGPTWVHTQEDAPLWWRVFFVCPVNEEHVVVVSTVPQEYESKRAWSALYKERTKAFGYKELDRG